MAPDAYEDEIGDLKTYGASGNRVGGDGDDDDYGGGDNDESRSNYDANGNDQTNSNTQETSTGFHSSLPHEHQFPRCRSVSPPLRRPPHSKLDSHSPQLVHVEKPPY